MKIFNRSVYNLIYGSGKGAMVIKKKRKYRIAGSSCSVLLFIGAISVGMGIIRGCILAGLLVFCIWIAPELLLYQKAKDLQLSIKLDIPNFLDVIALLLEAGQPLWYAVRTAGEMGDSQLSCRILKAFQSGGNMETSRNPEALLEQFSLELRMPEITSVVAAIVQNSRKGERELAGVLRMQSSICRQERRDIAEELGNRASNIMLIPSGMVFIAILIMLVAPAIMQLSIF